MLCRILSINFRKKKYFRRHFWENRQEPLVTFSRFWPLKGWEGVNPLKKENLDENFFQIMLNEILESCENDIC